MNFFKGIAAEWRAILKDPVVMLIVFGGTILYSFLYPLPYAKQVPREQKITVVNLDKSQVSYRLERMVDATPQVQIVDRSHTIEEAKNTFLAREVSGILVIPEHFYEDLLMGKSPTLSYAGDASYFLVYGTVMEGLLNAGGTLSAKAKIVRMLMEGQPLAGATTGYAATAINLKPTFNTRMGYLDYVVPGVFMLILHQTLIIAAGVMVTTQKSGKGYWTELSTFTLMLIRCLVFIGIYYVISAYYFGASLQFQGISVVGKMSELLLFLFPFLLAACFLGIWLGTWIPRRELVTIVVLFSSMPLLFASGFIWPIEAIPQPIIWLSRCFPSTPGIMGMISLDKMGATWQQTLPQWGLLWLQSLAWGSLALWRLSATRKKRIS